MRISFKTRAAAPLVVSFLTALILSIALFLPLAHAQGPATAPVLKKDGGTVSPAASAAAPDPAASSSQQAAPVPQKPAPAPVMKLDPGISGLVDEAKAAAGRAERLAKDVEKVLADVRMKVKRPDMDIAALADVRKKLDAERIKLLEGRKIIEDPLTRVRQQLATLGEPPKDGKEDPAIAARRQALQAVFDRLVAADKKLELMLVEIGQLSEQAADRQRRLFFSRIFEPSRSIFNPLLWYEGLATFPDLALRFKSLVVSWINQSGRSNLPLLVVLGVFFAALGLLIAVWRRWRAARPDEHLDDFRRLWRAVRIALLTAAIVLLALMVTNLALYTLGSASPRFMRLLDAISSGLLFAVSVTALARGIFRPGAPRLRLVNIADAGARDAYRLSAAIAFLQGLYVVVDSLAEILFLPVSFSVFWSAAISMMQMILIAWLLIRLRQAAPMTPQEREEDEAASMPAATGEQTRFFFGWARHAALLIWLALVIAAFALMLGYVAFARFLIGQTVVSAALIVALYLLHHLADAAVRNALDARTYTGIFLRRTLGIPERVIKQLGVLFSTLVDIGIVFVGLPLVLMQWAVNWVDLTSWMQVAFFGFKVGNIVIEPASILLGVLVLIIGLILTRLLVLWLDRRVLSRLDMDDGIRHSLVTTAKYTLNIASVLVALSVAGVNFSSLAIIGGALGVGIGFGLQSIVNNFVSGLILLAERPIKVGDWIKVSGGEGVVRKIRVRSTEIETFDRCSIIVPNSSLISEPVSNWYHSSRMGRLRLAIGVSYDADPDEVAKILLRCANAHPRALANPKAFVLFTGFGESSLDFELRVYIDDAGYLASTASGLRFAIFRALKQAGIEIPFPQRDLHLRSLPPEMFDRGELPPTPEEITSAGKGEGPTDTKTA